MSVFSLMLAFIHHHHHHHRISFAKKIWLLIFEFWAFCCAFILRPSISFLKIHPSTYPRVPSKKFWSFVSHIHTQRESTLHRRIATVACHRDEYSHKKNITQITLFIQSFPFIYSTRWYLCTFTFTIAFVWYFAMYLCVCVHIKSLLILQQKESIECLDHHHQFNICVC